MASGLRAAACPNHGAAGGGNSSSARAGVSATGNSKPAAGVFDRLI